MNWYRFSALPFYDPAFPLSESPFLKSCNQRSKASNRTKYPAFRGLFSIQDEVEGRQLIEISRHPALHDSFRHVIASRQEQVEELQLR